MATQTSPLRITRASIRTTVRAGAPTSHTTTQLC